MGAGPLFVPPFTPPTLSYSLKLGHGRRNAALEQDPKAQSAAFKGSNWPEMNLIVFAVSLLGLLSYCKKNK